MQHKPHVEVSLLQLCQIPCCCQHPLRQLCGQVPHTHPKEGLPHTTPKSPPLCRDSLPGWRLSLPHKPQAGQGMLWDNARLCSKASANAPFQALMSPVWFMMPSFIFQVTRIHLIFPHWLVFILVFNIISLVCSCHSGCPVPSQSGCPSTDAVTPLPSPYWSLLSGHFDTDFVRNFKSSVKIV